MIDVGGMVRNSSAGQWVTKRNCGSLEEKAERDLRKSYSHLEVGSQRVGGVVAKEDLAYWLQ